MAAATHMDDEYVWAGVEDPKIVVTTSHNPSSRLKQFAKVCFPNVIREQLPILFGGDSECVHIFN